MIFPHIYLPESAKLLPLSFHDWRPTLMCARTINDSEYAPDAGQFKLKMVYITTDKPS